jgi:hypothetical protein
MWRWLLDLLRDPVWQGIGAVIAIIALIYTVFKREKFRAYVSTIKSFFRSTWKWLVQQWRYLVIGILLIVIEVLLYLAYTDWRTVVFSLAHFALIAVAAWLLARHPVKPYGYEPSYREEFCEDFQRGLENWEYHGERWRTEREGDRHILIVTDSEIGGIAKPCLSWKDYVFRFETKIVKSNTSWIIRAKDRLNYVMLQCGQEQLKPHFRVNGTWRNLEWTNRNPVSLPITLPVNTWFGVHIEVRGTKVLVTVRVNDRETEILNSSALLEPPTAPVSYPMGSVGFREYGPDECAHFRNVRVKRLF